MPRPAHQRHVEHRVGEGQARALRHVADAATDPGGPFGQGLGGEEGAPQRGVAPAVGPAGGRPSRARSSVVLPWPLRPRTARISPRAIANDRWRTIHVLPNATPAPPT